MGVTSTGKSSVGFRLADALGGRFVDGDDLHPAANREKMARGVPLGDADRWPWLDRVGATLAGGEGTTVIACSALRRAYRDRLRTSVPDARFVHLTGPRDLIAARMAARRGHFMPPSLLDSQIATLEPPGEDERAVAIDIGQPEAAVLARILIALDAVP
jgi:gluconokinase